jgi:hypothetical protein
MFERRSVRGVGVVVAMAAAACSAPAAEAPPSLTSAQLLAPSPKLATQVTPILLAHRSEGGGPSGSLVVSVDLVRRCERLQATRFAARPADEEKLWLGVLQTLADCMNTAEHAEARLVITGGSRPDALVRYTLAKMGVDRERIDAMETVSADDDCALDDECTSFAVRIDLAPAASSTARL